MATIEGAIKVVNPYVKQWEGNPKYNADRNMIAFDDGYGTPTIGWGNTYYPDGSRVQFGDVITSQRGQELFDWEIGETANEIAGFFDISTINDNQFAALISFAYTAGVTGLKESRLLAAIKNGTSGDALKAVWITSYITSKGKYSRGLVNRRKDEFTLWNNTYSPAYSYYLRNEEAINKSGLIIGGIATIALSVYIYFLTKKKKG